MNIRILNKYPMEDYRSFCKVTQGIDDISNLKPIDNELKFWIKQCLALHSTIRTIHFRITDSISRSVAMQIIRSTDGHPQPEVESSRPDWTGKPRSNDPNELKLVSIEYTPESFLKMARKRLCNRTEKYTRETVNNWVNQMKDSKDPLIKAIGMCAVPTCVYCGNKCPEIMSCGKCEPLWKDYYKEEK